MKKKIVLLFLLCAISCISTGCFSAFFSSITFTSHSSINFYPTTENSVEIQGTIYHGDSENQMNMLGNQYNQVISNTNEISAWDIEDYLQNLEKKYYKIVVEIENKANMPFNVEEQTNIIEISNISIIQEQFVSLEDSASYLFYFEIIDLTKKANIKFIIDMYFNY